jgi:hypothetical protein
MTKRTSNEKRRVFLTMLDTHGVARVTFAPSDNCTLPEYHYGYRTRMYEFAKEGARVRTNERGFSAVIEVPLGRSHKDSVRVFVPWSQVYAIVPESSDHRHWFWPKDAPGGSIAGHEAAIRADQQLGLRRLAQKVRPKEKKSNESGEHTLSTAHQRARARWGMATVYEGKKA